MKTGKIGAVMAISVAFLSVGSATGATFQLLYTFAGGLTGGTLSSGVVMDASGNLYGTTSAGGASYAPPNKNGGGVVYQLSPDNQETVVSSFPTAKYVAPSGVILGPDGDLFGTVNGETATLGAAYRFKISGKRLLLHTFGANVQDGTHPNGLISDRSGNLYGTTLSGGTYNLGTIFKLSPKGVETILHNFGPGDATQPNSALVMDTAGNLYGEANNGQGASAAGAIFKLLPDGNETVLYNFISGGNTPQGGLVMDAVGNLYGTCPYGDSKTTLGTIFEITKRGQGRVIYRFKGGTDGYRPGGLTIDAQGNLFGVADLGGLNGYGEIYELTTSGQKIDLHDFNAVEGNPPLSPLLLTTSGVIYGATANTDAGPGAGSVFELSP